LLGQSRRNRVRDSGPVLQDVIIPEPQDPAALLFEILISLSIAAVGVLSVVRFDNKFRLNAGEICDIRRNRVLPTKMAAELIVTKCSP
jgi:hypothetical protein